MISSHILSLLSLSSQTFKDCLLICLLPGLSQQLPEWWLSLSRVPCLRGVSNFAQSGHSFDAYGGKGQLFNDSGEGGAKET